MSNMGRKMFIRNIIFAFAASVVPNVLKCKSSGMVLRKRSDGETTIGIGAAKWETVSSEDYQIAGLNLSESEMAYMELNKAIIKFKPKGRYIDLRYLRNIIEKRNKQNGLD